MAIESGLVNLFNMNVETAVETSYQDDYSTHIQRQDSDTRSWNYQSTEVYSPTFVVNSPQAEVTPQARVDLTHNIDASQESAMAHTPTFSAEQVAGGAGAGGLSLPLIGLIGTILLIAIFLWRR